MKNEIMKAMKRFTAASMAAITMFSAVPVTTDILEEVAPGAYAAEAETITVSGKLGDNIKWTLDDSGKLEVTGKGATYVMDSDSEIQQHSDEIKSIVINEGITEIKDWAFSGLGNVKEALVLPSTLKKIGRYSFIECGFTEIVLPDSLESIGQQAFQGNKNLKKLNIPDNLKTLGKSVFDGCTSINTITCKGSCKNYFVKDNVLFNKDKTTLVFYPAGLTADSYTVPSGVKKIERMNNSSLKTITLPDGLEEIGYGSFARNNITKISIPDSVKVIGESAFQSCGVLEKLEFPESLTSIGYDAFLYCAKLKEVVFKSRDCKIGSISLRQGAVITGYMESTAHEFAETYGYEFHNLETGDTVSESATNETFLAMLPTSGIEASVPMEGGSNQIYINSGYEEAEDSLKKAVREKTKELISGCSTDYDKAKAIYRFVNQHMTYRWGTSCNLLGAWEGGVGNCETYALLTSTMLYYAGIPHAYAFTADHVYNLALCEGRWIDIDSQGLFDRGVNAHAGMKRIQFTTGDLTYWIDDTKGVKLVGIGYSYSDTDKKILKNGIDVPDWVAGAYKSAVNAYDGIEIRGTKGKGAEKAADALGYKCKSESGSSFIANKEHAHKVTEVIKPATNKIDGTSKCECARCGKAETVRFPHVDYIVPGSWEYKYTGKGIRPKLSVVDADNHKIDPSFYTVKYVNNRKPGKATAVVTFKGAYSGTEKVGFTILKAKNTIKANNGKVTVKASRLRKASKSVSLTKAAGVKKAAGTVTFKKTGGSKQITVKNGKAIVKKGTKKGTYRIELKVKASGNKCYKSKTVKTELTVVVK